MEFSAETVMGMIWMLVLGPAVGNYATSVVYRLPRGETPFEKHPYCGDCNSFLTPRDLFPIISYLLSKGRCRHCGVRIRPSYFYIEWAHLVLFLSFYLLLGMGQSFLVLTAAGVFWIIIAAIQYHERWVAGTIAAFVGGLQLVHSALIQQSIYPPLQHGVMALVVGVMVWRIFAHEKAKHINEVPSGVWLGCLLAMGTPASLLLYVAAIYLAGMVLLRHQSQLHGGFAVWVWWCVQLATYT